MPLHTVINCIANSHYLRPNRNLITELPIFRSIPAFDMGMPVFLAIFCFACVIPSIRFHEKLTPGILIESFIMPCRCLFLYRLMDFPQSLQVPVPSTYLLPFATVLLVHLRFVPSLSCLLTLLLQVVPCSFA